MKSKQENFKDNGNHS